MEQLKDAVHEAANTVLAGLKSIPDKLPLVVAGDIMVDRYVHGTVDRVSPEAPVPIFDVGEETACPGGAANVANNLIKLGAKVVLVGRVGPDEDGIFIHDAFHNRADLCLLTVDGYTTERKTRYVTDMAQVIRVDTHSDPEDISSRVARDLAGLVEDTLSQEKLSGIVVSDYAKGTISDGVALVLRNTLPGVRCFVDCKPSTFPRYQRECGNPMTLKPNQREFLELGGSFDACGMAVGLGKFVWDKSGIDELLITQGARGMALVCEKLARQYHLPSTSREVYSVIGAGDTALAVYAWCRSGGMGAIPSAIAATAACSETVQHRYTSVIGRQELMDATKAFIKSGML